MNLSPINLGSGVVSGPRFELGKGAKSCEKTSRRTGGLAPLGHSRSWENRSSFCPTSKALAVSYRAGAVVGHVMEKGTGWDLGFWREDGRNMGKTKKEDAERGKSMGATGRKPEGEKTPYICSAGVSAASNTENSRVTALRPPLCYMSSPTEPLMRSRHASDGGIHGGGVRRFV